MKEFFLGIDVGSVSTNLVLMNPDKSVEEKIEKMTAFNIAQIDIEVRGIN